MDALRSLDPRASRDAWNEAYPWLWSAGMRLATRLLSGGEWESQREDAVAAERVALGFKEAAGGTGASLHAVFAHTYFDGREVTQ